MSGTWSRMCVLFYRFSGSRFRRWDCNWMGFQSLHDNLFPKQGLHWWGFHGIALVPWTSPTLWSAGCRGAVPRLSLADSLESGKRGIWKSRNLEIWESRSLEIWDPKECKNKYVGKVWISRKKAPDPFSRHFKPFQTMDRNYILIFKTVCSSLS